MGCDCSRLGVLQEAAANQVLSYGKTVRARTRGARSSGVGGSLNMVFRAVNPLQGLLPLYDLVPGIIGQAMKYSVMADALVGTSQAMVRFLESMAWKAAADPLVIDLDGDGIETTGVGTSSAYFDVDGDLFAERTGWLKGDDGFLVLDGVRARASGGRLSGVVTPQGAHRRAAAANDNQNIAWREATFRLCG